MTTGNPFDRLSTSEQFTVSEKLAAKDSIGDSLLTSRESYGDESLEHSVSVAFGSVRPVNHSSKSIECESSKGASQ